MTADDEYARMRPQHGHRLTRRGAFPDDDTGGRDGATRAHRTDDACCSGIRIGGSDHDDHIGFGEFLRKTGDGTVDVEQRNRIPLPAFPLCSATDR